MTKAREPGSIADAIERSRVELGAARACNATGKSEALIRHWGDPDDDAHHIPLHQALALDKASVSAGKPAHIFNAYRQEIERHADCEAAAIRLAGAASKPKKVTELLAAAVAEVGDVARAIDQALEGDGALSRSECHRIMLEAQQAKNRLDAIVERVRPARPRAGARRRK